MVLAVVGALVIGWVVFKQTLSATTKGAVRPILGGPEVLVNETVEVKDDGWRMFTFRLDSRVTVDFEFDVIKGDGATAYIIADAERERFTQARSAGMGQFRHYEALAGKEKKQHRSYAGLNAGAYALVISESSAQNILGKPDKATVRVTIASR